MQWFFGKVCGRFYGKGCKLIPFYRFNDILLHLPFPLPFGGKGASISDILSSKRSSSSPASDGRIEKIELIPFYRFNDILLHLPFPLPFGGKGTSIDDVLLSKPNRGDEWCRLFCPRRQGAHPCLYCTAYIN